MPSLAQDLAFRGLVYQVTDPALLALLDREPITLYGGFDPTADTLQLGNLLQLCTLRRFQLAGHRSLALAGGATGMVGDPGGRAEERQLLDADQHRVNMAGIRAQIERFLDVSDAEVMVLDNADWLGSMPVMTFLRDVGKHFTVNQMVAKESVRSRLDRPDQGISYTEFSYMLLQAYDFLHLYGAYDCRLQIGGSDQWGNITMGVDLVRKVRGAEVWGLTSPLVLKADGTKLGKSETGTVWLDARRTSPYQLYQFLLRSEDAVVGQYLRYFTFLEHSEIIALDEATVDHPERRDAQRALAREVCRLVHGEAETQGAERAAAALFTEAIAELDEATLLVVFEDAPTSTLSQGRLDAPGLSVIDGLVESGLVASKSQARNLIRQGGVSVNNRKVDDESATVGPSDLISQRYVVLRRGRRDYHLLRFE